MMHRKILIAGLLPLLALPLMGESCTEEKLVSLSIGADTTAEFIAEGSENWTDETDVIDVNEDIDLAGALEDNDIDPNDVISAKISRIYYRVTVPDPNPARQIVNGNVSIERINVGSSAIVNNFSGAAGAATDWIEITETLDGSGVILMNNFLADALSALQNGTSVPNPLFEYHVDGQSVPAEATTNFQWELKISFVIQGTQTFDVPNF